jgi:Uma2 family endonuclease
MAITTARPVSEETFRQLALGNSRLELHRGQLREKPGMSVEHGHVMDDLLAQLYAQLDRRVYRLRAQHARLRVSSATYYVPDIAIIPRSMEQMLRARRGTLDAYSDPLPLVIEIWSPSTGAYDLSEKLTGYQQRGDLEIWYLHPYEHTLTAWRRQPVDSYAQSIHHSGTVSPTSLPGLTIDLETLFTP